MAVFVVSVEVNLQNSQNCAALWNALNELGAQPLLSTVWAIQGGFTAAAVRDKLAPCVGMYDRILALDRSSGDWAGQNLMADLEQF